MAGRGARARTDPVTIAVLGADAVAAQLKDVLAGAHDPGAAPSRFGRSREFKTCATTRCYSSAAENNARLRDVIAAVGTRPVLIVTDAADGLSDGAMVNFQLVDQRVRFEISLRKAQDSGLMLSSRLLSAALRVETSGCWYDAAATFPAVEREICGAPGRGPTRGLARAFRNGRPPPPAGGGRRRRLRRPIRRRSLRSPRRRPCGAGRLGIPRLAAGYRGVAAPHCAGLFQRAQETIQIELEIICNIHDWVPRRSFELFVAPGDAKK